MFAIADNICKFLIKKILFQKYSKQQNERKSSAPDLVHEVIPGLLDIRGFKRKKNMVLVQV